MADSSWDMTFATAPATPLPRGSNVWMPGRGADSDPSPSSRISPPIVEATAPSTSNQRSPSNDIVASTARPLQPRKSMERIQPTSSPRQTRTPSGPSAYNFEARRIPSTRSIRERILEYENAASPQGSSKSIAKERMRESEREAIASSYRKASAHRESSSATSSPSHSLARSSASRSSAASSPGMPRALAVPSVSASPFPTPSQLRDAANVPPPSSTSYLPSSPYHFTPSTASRPLLRASRRESSPGLNASRLGGINFGNEESFLGSVGDKTYDELEVAVADNNRRRSFGIALRAPLPPSPDDSTFGEAPSSPVSPSRSARRSSPEHAPAPTAERSPSPVAPSVRISVDEERDALAMPPPPVPQPRDRALLRTPSAATPRHTPRRGSPLRERVDEGEQALSTDGSAARPRTTSTTSSSGSNTAHSPRLRRHESVSTLGSLGGGSLLRDMAKTDSLRSVDASFQWDRIDRQAAASRLDSRLPDLLDAGSFRLSPPRSNRPSAREIFEEKEYLASPSATAVRKGTYSQNQASATQTPRRAARPISLDPDMAGDMTLDLQQLVRRSGRPKRPSGTEESLLGPTVGELADELADLSDADDDTTSVMRQPRSAPPAADREQRAAREEEPREATVGLQRTSSVRSGTSSHRSDTVRSGTLERADSKRTLQRSDSGRTLQRSDSVRSTGIQRSDGTRSTAVQRSSSVRSHLPASGSTRMPTSASGRSLASLATPRRDRPDVPLTMRKRAQERATSGATGAIPKSASATSATSEDRWADAVERDLVPELKPRPAAVERRGLPSSSSSRRLNPGPSASGLTRTTSVRSVRADASGTTTATASSSGSTRPLARSSSVRQALVADTQERPSTRATATGITRSGSRPSLAARSMPPPPVPQRAMPAPRSSLAAKTLSAPPRSSLLPSSRASGAPAGTIPKSSSRPSLALPRSSSRPSLAPPGGGLPKSSSRTSLAPSLPKSSSRPSLAPQAGSLPKSSSRTSLAPALPKSSSRTSLAPRPRPSAAPALSEAADALNAPTRRPAAPGAGVALARTKLSAPPALDRPAAAASTRREAIAAGTTATGVRSSRPASSGSSSRFTRDSVPATPAGRAPRAAMVPRTAVKRVV